jgi:hypothetical protein
MSYHEERSIAAKAKAVIDSLTPSTERTDANVHAVRLAAGTARDATKNLSGEEGLDNARGEAAIALSGLCGLMDRRATIQDMTDRACKAVAMWLRELERMTGA